MSYEAILALSALAFGFVFYWHVCGVEVMKDVMIDIETLGNGKCAAIVQIGACYFDRATGALGKTFKANVDARTQPEADFDADTIYWWLSQSREAIESITADPKFSLSIVLNDLNDFLADAKAIWSHATFDFVIITEAFRRLGIKQKFHYRTCRDIRTLVDLAAIDTANVEIQRVGTHHDGLDDAIHQVKYCVLAFQKLGSKKPLEHKL